MKDILEKLNRIKDQVLSEHPDGKLRLFALLARNDHEGRWDVLMSADWLEKTNSEKDLIYLIEKLKSEFANNLEFLVRVVTGNPEEVFIKQLARAISKENSGIPGELSKLQLNADFVLDQMYVIAFDFRGVDLEKHGTDKGPVGVKEISNFE